MRQSAYWMQQLDERILEYLDQEGWGSPSIMARESGFRASEGRIGERCKMLQYAGLVAPIHGDTYELTIEGQLYLEEEIDARYRPRPSARRVLRG